jgi:pilus assembly protein Flp/PilA
MLAEGVTLFLVNLLFSLDASLQRVRAQLARNLHPMDCGLRYPVRMITTPLHPEEIKMTVVLNYLSRLHKDETGQGLVEYLLVLALVAFAATAGMGSLASFLNQAFSAIGSLLNQYIA